MAAAKNHIWQARAPERTVGSKGQDDQSTEQCEKKCKAHEKLFLTKYRPFARGAGSSKASLEWPLRAAAVSNGQLILRLFCHDFGILGGRRRMGPVGSFETDSKAREGETKQESLAGELGRGLRKEE